MLNKDLIKHNSYEEILQRFKPKIKKTIQAIPINQRGDLEQEIMIKLFDKMDTIKNINAPGFFELKDKMVKK
ncbi:hypothetical protein [Halalkalibacter sp. APA_J-10(15)]|uniref:hypothetical protein n=1 Tax=Halalkalibacter sp. APA_J-10(15) TaxID=2933805 RepID=UPI001FF1487F|nr:hypothetical protein [Halalkalibacter sp. APA_J-10(15)]MCK0470277.1 hypothetical protein [Halalkalibacter sp. APA_J-10(15)]